MITSTNKAIIDGVSLLYFFIFFHFLEPSCSAARRATIDYSDIANYVKQWIKGQQSAKRTLESVKTTLNSEIEKADKKVGLFKKNMTSDIQELVSYWSGKAKTGMLMYWSTLLKSYPKVLFWKRLVYSFLAFAAYIY